MYLSLKKISSMDKIGIYIHIPFCLAKCNYCDFLSFSMDEETKAAYVNALIREIKGFKNAKNYQVISVFIGGGTPTVLKTEQVLEILSVVNECFTISKDAEITIECNPKTADLNKLKAFRKAGVNRLSIGIQSMDDRFLRLLGRVHTVQDVYETFSIAREAGFKNINADLMFSLPGQTVSDWKHTLELALDLKPEHVSAYSLIIEPDTPFYDIYYKALCNRDDGKEQNLLPSEEDELSMYEITKAVLTENGYKQYEVSNFAKEGHLCIHNDGYWLRRPYIGFGLGAASLIEEARFENTRDMYKYLESSADIWSKNKCTPLSKEDAMAETMFLGLRRTKGISVSAFKLKFDVDIMDIYGKIIEKQIESGYLILEGDDLYLTPEGNLISNICLAEYLPD